jgi:non-homologous end joining protein Ku
MRRFESTSTERVSFRQINKKTGNRLRQQLVDEVTREPVEGGDKGRGYEYAKNAYILSVSTARNLARCCIDATSCHLVISN